MKVEYKDIDEQIELIKAKNILIKDEEKAKKILLKENYYNLITGYKDIFIDIKKSKKIGTETCDEETFFEELYAVYKFDRDLRNLMFKYISIIETHIKSYVSHVFSKKYGTKNYLKEENFSIPAGSEERFKRLIKTIEDNVFRNLENYPEIKECKKENGDIPFWILVTLITFGSIVKFYIFMKNEDKIQVANLLNMNYKDVQNYLKMLNTIRNIAAHNNILFNVKLDIKYSCQSPELYHKTLGIQKQGHTYKSGINDIMAIIIILRKFLDNKEYNHFTVELLEIINEVKEELDNESFENLLEEMGIPKNYFMISKI